MKDIIESEKSSEEIINSLMEQKLTVAGENVIGLGGNQVVSISSNSKFVAVFQNDKGDVAKVDAVRNKFVADVNNRFDKDFDRIEALVQWLNKENYEFIGVDDPF